MTNPTDRIEVVVIDGRVRCIYLNDFRIAGAKPYASEVPKYVSFEVPAGEIRGHLKKAKRKPKEAT